MGTDMVDVEHGAVKGIAVISNPCRNRSVDAIHLLIGALAGGTSHGDLRQRPEANVFSVLVSSSTIRIFLVFIWLFPSAHPAGWLRYLPVNLTT